MPAILGGFKKALDLMGVELVFAPLVSIRRATCLISPFGPHRMILQKARISCRHHITLVPFSALSSATS
jgi:hypothetical protein